MGASPPRCGCCGPTPSSGERTGLPAAYVHGLMVDRSAAGRGLGEALLRWAAEQGRAAGVGLLRLDCVESNTALLAYYRRLGFTEVGRREFERFHSVTLLQQRLG
ncbi:GNAT family N-acetyltransferase [Salinifilum aidingensis]